MYDKIHYQKKKKKKNHLFWESSLFLPCLALAANLCFSLMEWKLTLEMSWWADELQILVSPPVCTWAIFSFVSASAIWAFLPIGFDVENCLGLEVLFEHFANWFLRVSDVEDYLWTLLLVHSCQLVLTSIYLWGPLVSTMTLTLVSVIWAFCQLVLTSATTGDASVGEVFVCESVSVSLGEGLWQTCCLVHVCVYSICVSGILLPYAKWEIQVQFIKKNFSHGIMTNKKETFFEQYIAKYSLDS